MSKSAYLYNTVTTVRRGTPKAVPRPKTTNFVSNGGGMAGSHYEDTTFGNLFNMRDMYDAMHRNATRTQRNEERLREERRARREAMERAAAEEVARMQQRAQELDTLLRRWVTTMTPDSYTSYRGFDGVQVFEETYMEEEGHEVNLEL